MTISKDRVKPSPFPDSWKLSEIFATGVVLGGYLALMTVIFFWAAYETDFFPVRKFSLRQDHLCLWFFLPWLRIILCIGSLQCKKLQQAHPEHVRWLTSESSQRNDGFCCLSSSQHHQSGLDLRDSIQGLFFHRAPWFSSRHRLYNRTSGNKFQPFCPVISLSPIWELPWLNRASGLAGCNGFIGQSNYEIRRD